MVMNDGTTARVRACFETVYYACGGPEAEGHFDWLPGVLKPEDAYPALKTDSEARAAYMYLLGVADALGLGLLGMLDRVLRTF